MNEDNGFCLGFIPGFNRFTKRQENAEKIEEGVSEVCFEIIARIEREHASLSHRDLIDLSMALSGLVGALNISALRNVYNPLTAFGTGTFDDRKGDDI